MLTNHQIEEFILGHRLPGKFRDLINRYYSNLASWLLQQLQPDNTLFVGINGAQGTGKSTLAAYLKLALEADEKRRVAVLSIDDFYLTQAERLRLAERVHPLMQTRGVPGTHDIPLLAQSIEQLKRLDQESHTLIPRFDKSLDDRVESSHWSQFSGPVDLIILEGWCVGTKAQTENALLRPVNALERDQDPSGKWRRYVNQQLESDYAALFAKLNALIFLQAPDFGAVYRWRLEQEEKLAIASPNAAGVMNSDQVADFIQYYERLTRANIETLPDTADVVVQLDVNHDCAGVCYPV